MGMAVLLISSVSVSVLLETVFHPRRLRFFVRPRVTLPLSMFEQEIESIRRFGDHVVVMGADRVVYAAPSPNAGQTQRRRVITRLASIQYMLGAFASLPV